MSHHTDPRPTAPASSAQTEAAAGHDLPPGATPAPFHQHARDPLSPAEAFFVTARDGIRLRLGLWRPEGTPRATVLLFQGRTEYLEKYAPAARRLTAAGLAVLAIDWRGQGLSDRLIADPRPGHIDHFSSYQIDVAALVATAEALALPRPWHLLAHSMGGAIGLAALAEGLPVATAAFSSPMWGIHHAPLPGPVVMGIAGTARRLGRGRRAAVGTGGEGTFVLDAPFRGNALTGNAAEWARLVSEAGAWPELTLGGATYDWVRAGLAECRRLATLPSPEIPAVIGLGGREEVVSPQAIRTRAARWPAARLAEYPDGHHELLMETPAIADAFMAEVLALFAKA